MGRKLTNEEFLQKLKDLGRDDLEPLEQYIGTHTKIKFRCTKPECGHEWYMEPNCVTSMGQGCPKCGILKNIEAIKMSQDEFENKIGQINPSIIVIGQYTGSKNKVKVKCVNEECGYEWEAVPDSLYRGMKCPKCGEKNTTQLSDEEVNNRIQKANSQVRLKGNYTGWENKIKLECNNGHIWEEYLNGFLKNPYCPVCTDKRNLLIKGINDLATLRPDLVAYFKNKEEATNLTLGSNRKVKLICPDCGFEKEGTGYELASFGFRCPQCGDGVSYPNKFLRNFLTMMCVDYYPEWSADWCEGYRYDAMFKLSNKKYLVEVDGLQHKTGFMKNKKIANNDKIKDELAKDNGYTLIRIDCGISDPEFIYQKMKETLLAQLFDLENFDWQECGRRSEKSLMIEVCKYYNEHFNEPLLRISEIFKMNKETPPKYIKRGYKIGIVKVNPRRLCGSKIVSVFKDGNLLKTYISVTVCAQKFQEDFGVEGPNRDLISKLVLSSKSYQGYTFKYAETLADIAPDYNAEVDKMFNPTPSKQD